MVPLNPKGRDILSVLLPICIAARLPCVSQLIVPAIPQSEVLAKFFEEIGEKRGEILAKFFANFRPSISRENGLKKFHENPRHFYPFVRAACLQNETAPEKILNRYEKRFEKREKRDPKNDLKRV